MRKSIIIILIIASIVFLLLMDGSECVGMACAACITANCLYAAVVCTPFALVPPSYVTCLLANSSSWALSVCAPVCATPLVVI